MIVIAAYIKLATKEYPRYEGDIRVDHPEITEDQTGDTFPDVDDYAPVAWVDPPEVNGPLEYAVEADPEQTADGWRMVWSVHTRTQAEWDAIEAAQAQAALSPEQRRQAALDDPGEAPDVVA